ncbi:MAG: hypothetical protein FRX49_07339 [Trebouxia sp. A1-2]|nr:MAG: hypothetical protein FRX49_07339 [Trebouxia sp. A1-2]
MNANLSRAACKNIQDCLGMPMDQDAQYRHKGKGNLLLHSHELALNFPQEALPHAWAGCKAGNQQLDAQQDCCHMSWATAKLIIGRGSKPQPCSATGQVVLLLTHVSRAVSRSAPLGPEMRTYSLRPPTKARKFGMC